MAPLPPDPEAPVPGGIDVTTVMFGQQWTGPGGEPMTASADGVVLRVIVGGTVLLAMLMDPEEAISTALRIQNAAVTAINKSVDDDGNHPSLAARINRINAAHKGPRP